MMGRGYCSARWGGVISAVLPIVHLVSRWWDVGRSQWVHFYLQLVFVTRSSWPQPAIWSSHINESPTTPCPFLSGIPYRQPTTFVTLTTCILTRIPSCNVRYHKSYSYYQLSYFWKIMLESPKLSGGFGCYRHEWVYWFVLSYLKMSDDLWTLKDKKNSC